MVCTREHLALKWADVESRRDQHTPAASSAQLTGFTIPRYLQRLAFSFVVDCLPRTRLLFSRLLSAALRRWVGNTVTLARASFIRRRPRPGIPCRESQLQASRLLLGLH
jgi:hypothetical protein